MDSPFQASVIIQEMLPSAAVRGAHGDDYSVAPSGSMTGIHPSLETWSIFRYSSYDGQDYNNGGYTNIGYTAHTVEKRKRETNWKITWTDSWRTIAPGGVCLWQVFIDGESCLPTSMEALQHNTQSGPSCDHHQR